ncbi:methionyl-tRNA formyltransferase [Flavobacteriaceae bacterium MHTCC 0001]
MRKLRIVFMGTPNFAVASLKALVEDNYNIVGVITAPDKPAGRGRKLNESAVKTYAKTIGLHILQPANLKNETFIDELKSLNANLQIVVAFRMLPKVVWQMPQYGTFNLHASLLPNYRGAAPINWAIINGESTTGVTTFFIDEKIDTGAIIDSKSIAIDEDESAGNLHDRLMVLGSELLIDTVATIASGQTTTTVQKETKNLKTAYKLNRHNCKIDWNAPIGDIHNLIRGLSPYPAAWCQLVNGNDVLDIKVYETEKETEAHNYSNGTIISTKKSLKVCAQGGFIKIKKIKLPGKKLMDTTSLLNGFDLKKDAKMR